MSRLLTIAMMSLVLLVGYAAWGGNVKAEDRAAQERAMQEERGAWFRSLKQPVTGMSCCDVSDCRRTEADWRGGQWWAVVENNWTPIPREKQLDKLSIDGDAYVCAGPRGTIYCFVPPSMAM